MGPRLWKLDPTPLIQPYNHAVIDAVVRDVMMDRPPPPPPPELPHQPPPQYDNDVPAELDDAIELQLTDSLIKRNLYSLSCNDTSKEGIPIYTDKDFEPQEQESKTTDGLMCMYTGPVITWSHDPQFFPPKIGDFELYFDSFEFGPEGRLPKGYAREDKHGYVVEIQPNAEACRSSIRDRQARQQLLDQQATPELCPSCSSDYHSGIQRGLWSNANPETTDLSNELHISDLEDDRQ